MQSAIIITNLILCVLAFIGIYLKLMKLGKKPWGILRMAVIPGATAGLIISHLTINPITSIEVVLTASLGVLTSEIIYIFYLIARSTWKEQKATVYYDDGTPSKYFITGDKHRNFEYVKAFCRDMSTRRKDVLIILGDCGFNYFEDKRDDKLKREISNLNITLFCLHGNKENRPQNIATYGIRSFCGGKVYYEPKYPNILFAIDGEIYNFEGRKYVVAGGAHSVDKMRCIKENKPFWEDEMPNDEIKAKVEAALQKENNIIYGIMTHTCPIKYLPNEMFMSTRQNAIMKNKSRKRKTKNFFKPDIDRSTEEWLDKLEKEVDYKVWFCGHYHIDKQIDKVHMMCREIRPLNLRLNGED